ncbi:uncharacterized protein LOC142008355 [Carettochelys insculpta]|uniref:uncharacterized protein LOC142008355 n=1 Tax=Carettochelys insculpta TaxID=44489 RepID=UPI003EB89118
MQGCRDTRCSSGHAWSRPRALCPAGSGLARLLRCAAFLRGFCAAPPRPRAGPRPSPPPPPGGTTTPTMPREPPAAAQHLGLPAGCYTRPRSPPRPGATRGPDPRPAPAGPEARGMAAEGAAQVAFEEVAVYFSPAEWAALEDWQRELYRDVMRENYELVASLGRPAAMPEIIHQMEQDEEPCVGDPPHPSEWRTPQPVWPGDGLGIKKEKEEEAQDPETPEPPGGFSGKREEESRPPRRVRRRSSLAPGRSPRKPRRRRVKSAQDGPPRALPQKVLLKQNPPTCPECDKSFRSNTALTIHERSHTGERPFKCPTCGKGFPSKGDLKRHQKTHVGKADADPQRAGGLPHKLLLPRPQQSPRAPKGPHSCAQCGKSFRRSRDLRKHQRSHTAARPFPCLQCGSSFRLKQILVSHQKVHQGVKPFQCPDCGRSFSQKHHLVSHQRTHTGERPFPCRQCGHSFTQKHHLLSHQRIHTGERPFACAWCGKCFKDKKTLVIHERIHTGERPYRCSQCGKTCSQKQHLKSHQRVHRGGGPGGEGEQGLGEGLALPSQGGSVAEKLFQCAECEKRFRDERIMRAHQRTHAEQAQGQRTGAGASQSPRPLLRPEPFASSPQHRAQVRARQAAPPGKRPACPRGERAKRFTQNQRSRT